MSKKYVKRFIFGLILIVVGFLFIRIPKEGAISGYTIFALIFLFLGFVFIAQAIISPIMKRLMGWLEIERH